MDNVEIFSLHFAFQLLLTSFYYSNSPTSNRFDFMNHEWRIRNNRIFISIFFLNSQIIFRRIREDFNKNTWRMQNSFMNSWQKSCGFIKCYLLLTPQFTLNEICNLINKHHQHDASERRVKISLLYILVYSADQINKQKKCGCVDLSYFLKSFFKTAIKHFF